jgi:hypothetical protein
MSNTIWERTKSALTSLGVPMAANVYIPATGAERPDQYLVYFLVVGDPLQHADNAETLRDSTVQVSIYSRNGLTGLPDVEGAMLAAGFTFVESRELPYSEDTRHFGLAIDFSYVEEKE